MLQTVKHTDIQRFLRALPTTHRLSWLFAVGSIWVSAALTPFLFGRIMDTAVGARGIGVEMPALYGLFAGVVALFVVRCFAKEYLRAYVAEGETLSRAVLRLGSGMVLFAAWMLAGWSVYALVLLLSVIVSTKTLPHTLWKAFWAVALPSLVLLQLQGAAVHFVVVQAMTLGEFVTATTLVFLSLDWHMSLLSAYAYRR